jgi:hypothetical protein
MILEKVFEDIICKYPELIENGLILKGRQITLYGRRMDVLFEDKFKRKLIIELKAGPIKDEHMGQILSYEGMLLSADDPTIRVMLVGNRVPPNLQKSLDHHGIAWKEITISILKAHLQSKGDLVLLASIEEVDQFFNVYRRPNIPNRVDFKQSSTSRRPQLNRATTFKDLCDIIRNLSSTVPTNYMDLLLLENENKTLSGILAQWQNYKGKNRDFQTISVIKRHITWRESHDGWIFSRSGVEKDPIVKLTGLKVQT